MNKINILLFLSMLFAAFNCKNEIDKQNLTKDNASAIKKAMEQMNVQENRVKKFRTFAGIIDLDTITPLDLNDKYFRIIIYPPFNRPFDIIEISNFFNKKPTITKIKVAFDYDCNFVSGKRKLDKDCFKTLDKLTKEITNKKLDSLFNLLDRTEFWNLNEESYDAKDVVILDGLSIEMAGYKTRRTYKSDSLSKYQNLIQRTSPEEYLGVSIILDFVNEIISK